MLRVGALGAAVAAVAGAGAFSACSSTVACTAERRNALVVTVLSAGGAAICDATVTATDGDYSTGLHPLGDNPPCQYVGAPERKGTYTVTARHAGRTVSLGRIEVTADRCHVHPRYVTLTLR